MHELNINARPRVPMSRPSRFVIDKLTTAALIVACASFLGSFIEPHVAAVIMLLGNTVIAFRHRAYFHPLIFSPTAIGSILLIGGLNISTYRGDIYADTFGYILRCILMVSFGAALVAMVRPRNGPRSIIVAEMPLYMLIAASAPALLGIGWIIFAVGVPLLSPEVRFLAPPKAVFLSQIMIAVAVLAAYRYVVRRRLDTMDYVVLPVIALLLLIPGYRNYIVVALLVSVIGLNRLGLLTMRLPVLASMMAGIFGFLTIVSQFRRATSGNLLSASDLASVYHVQYLPGPLVQLHVAFRESLGITQILLTRYPHWNGPSIFFADFMTLLPGKSESGGIMVADLLGSVLRGGLTPGLVGVLTIEYSRAVCMIFFLGMGLASGMLWRWLARTAAPEAAFLYAFLIVNFLLVFVRGIPQATNLIEPLYFLGVVVVAKHLKPRSLILRRPGQKRHAWKRVTETAT